MNGHVLDVRVARLLALYTATLETAGLRRPDGGTPIVVNAAMREETLQLAREVLATVPREPAEVAV